MPRTAREKSYESIFHIMVKSISEVKLFNNDDDKAMFMSTVKNYQNKYHFKVYAFCLMDNHAHFIIDVNGADISKVMHGINQSYAQYYNKTHNRVGHLFHDRFKSKMVQEDRYLLALSGYIHRNAKDLTYLNGDIANYKFSSLKVYLGLANDEFQILDKEFILAYFSINPEIAQDKYLDFVNICTDEKLKEEGEFTCEKTEYRSERRIINRDKSPDEIKEYVSKSLNTDSILINVKYNRSATTYKAICVVLMSSLCNMTQKAICEHIGNITQSRVSSLCKKGIELITSHYKYILNDLIMV